MIKLSNCPICKSDEIKDFIISRDYSTTKEEFKIAECTSCDFLFTNPRPKEEAMNRYYENDSYISHTNNKKGLFNLMYQIVRKHAIASKSNLLLKTSNSKKHLDIGCGTGEFLNALAKKGIECEGIEPSDIAREKAINNYKIKVNKNSDLKQYKEKEFDSISMWHVLEHVYDLNKTITNLDRIINEKGTIVIAVPNYKSFDAEYYKEFWAAWDLPIHLNHFSEKTIINIFEKNNFKFIKKKGMIFDSFYVSLLSNEFKNGKKQYLKGFFIGLLSNIKALLGNRGCSSNIYIFRSIK